MRTARCTLDDATYTADTFFQVEDFPTKKRFLVCTRCGGPAFYRSATRNGREACFGARPHAEGCDLAALEHQTEMDDGPPDHEIFTRGQRIIVDLNFGVATTVIDRHSEEGRDGAGGPTRHGTGGTTPRNYMYRRMSSLLRALVESDEFRRSDQAIEIAGQGEFLVADFFVNFADADDNHVGRFRGFWGMIPDARIAGNTLWFNSGGRDNMSALLDQRYFQDIAHRFNIDDVTEIDGAYILIFGELKRARNTGKKYVQITSPSYFTLRLAR